MLADDHLDIGYENSGCAMLLLFRGLYLLKKLADVLPLRLPLRSSAGFMYSSG